MYKLMTTSFETIKLNQPLSLSSLIRSSRRSHSVQSPIYFLILSKQIGRHSVTVTALVEWNKLLQTVRTRDTIIAFYCKLKTYLLRLALLSILRDLGTKCDATILS